MSIKNVLLKKEKLLTPRVSVTIIASSPEEEAYVMVLQNRDHEHGDTMNSKKSFSDVTFLVGLVGGDLIPIHCNREIICEKSGPLRQLIESAEAQEELPRKPSIRDKVRQKVSQLGFFSCGVVHGKPTFWKRLEILVRTYDPETFERLMLYIHNGKVTADATTVVGLMAAAYQFEVPELLNACWDFALGCAVRADNLLDLLVGARTYKDHAITQALLKEIKDREAEFPATQLYKEAFASLMANENPFHFDDDAT